MALTLEEWELDGGSDLDVKQHDHNSLSTHPGPAKGRDINRNDGLNPNPSLREAVLPVIDEGRKGLFLLPGSTSLAGEAFLRLPSSSLPGLA